MTFVSQNHPETLHKFASECFHALPSPYWLREFVEVIITCQIRQIIPAILWRFLCNCPNTQDCRDVLWHEEHYLSGADAFLHFDESSCSGILRDLSQHDNGRETDPLACARPGEQTARSRGQERSGHHAADSSDLFLISVMRACHTDHVAC